MLALLARCPGADELFESNRALAFALASSWVFRPPVARPLRSARSLLKKKRTAIARWLDFSDAPSCLRVLSKVLPSACTVARLLHLRESLRANDWPKALSHLPKLNAGVLRIVTDAALRPSAAFSLLEELTESPATAMQTAHLLIDAVRMHAQLHEGRRFSPRHSINGVLQLHDELAREFNGRKHIPDLSAELPPPPLLGTSSIVPLSSPVDLFDEGRAMRHCVASYLRLVLDGSTYVYRVLSPERATLSIVRAGVGWRVGELKGPGNGRISAETRQTVGEWFRAQTSSMPSGRRCTP
jgi:hypothetical protein